MTIMNAENGANVPNCNTAPKCLFPLQWVRLSSTENTWTRDKRFNLLVSFDFPQKSWQHSFLFQPLRVTTHKRNHHGREPAISVGRSSAGVPRATPLAAVDSPATGLTCSRLDRGPQSQAAGTSSGPIRFQAAIISARFELHRVNEMALCRPPL